MLVCLLVLVWECGVRRGEQMGFDIYCLRYNHIPYECVRVLP